MQSLHLKGKRYPVTDNGISKNIGYLNGEESLEMQNGTGRPEMERSIGLLSGVTIIVGTIIGKTIRSKSFTLINYFGKKAKRCTKQTI